MKKSFLLLLLFIGILYQNDANGQNYDFSAKAPSGQTLYYSLINNDTELRVVRPRDNYYSQLKDYNPTGKITIPEYVEYMGTKFPVSEIGDEVFSGCKTVTSVIIPSTVRAIGSYTFKGTSLTKIVLPPNLKEIRKSAFESTLLTEIEIPESVKQIGDNAFKWCKLKKVSILCRYASNGYSVFGGCDKIEEVFFNQYLDMSKDNLKMITFGEKMTVIPKTFQNCDQLEKVVIGNNIHVIPDDCFNDCDNLRVVTIGSKVYKIGDRAFRKCVSLDTIYAKPTNVPTLGSNAFNFTPSSKVVVTNCDSDYSKVWGSSEFIYITSNVYNLSLGVNNTSYGSAVFVQEVNCQNTAKIEASPKDDYKFIQWSDGNTDNPRTITLSHDTSINAIFERSTYTITSYSNNSTMGDVVGGGKYSIGENVTLTANAICGYRFSHWNNGSKTNPYTFVPTKDAAFVAFFEKAIDTIYVPNTTLEVITLYDTIRHTTTLLDTMQVTIPDTILFSAPNGSSIQDTIHIQETIPSANGQVLFLNAKIISNNGRITITGAQGETVRLYDLNGHEITTRKEESDGVIRFDVPVSSAYLVKIGNYSARSVVVIK